MPVDLVRVPPVGYQRAYWVADNDGMRSRSEMARASGEYSFAIPALIADVDFALPAELAANLAEATALLSSFDTFSAQSLGGSGASLGPMSAVLLRTESASSSQIEQLTVGARQLALADLGEAKSENARLVHGNVRAMGSALLLKEPITVGAIVGMHRELLRDDSRLGAYAGTLRDQLVWVGRSPVTPVGASFVAPSADLLEAALDDLVAFMVRKDLPVLAQVAIAHAQFETIHPFVDGNGRVGRVLVHYALRASGLVKQSTAPLSAGLLRETERYFEALTAYRAGDAGPIISQFSDAARYAAVTGRGLVAQLEEEVSRALALLHGVRRDAAAWRLIPLLVTNPVLDAGFVKARLGLSDAAAHRAINVAVGRGVLRETTGRSRRRLWQHDGILAVLDGYAAAIRRQ